MHDLSLHILDLIENSIAAQASVVSIGIDIDPQSDSLRLTVDDNGTGLNICPEDAVDPFYTTKSHKRVGLGLSLLQAAAEQAEGVFAIGPSPSLGGARVEARMRLSHIDRPPLGDMAATVSTMMSAHPQVEFRVRFRAGDLESDFSTLRDFDIKDPIAASMAAYKTLRARFEHYEYV
jgi:signal transduction histidine kinase